MSGIKKTMRCLLLLLFATPFCNAQDSLYGTKWYLNAAEISNFGENDTSFILTAISNDSYIFFGDKLEFGTAGNDELIPSYDYLFYKGECDYLNVVYYKTKREFRKKRNGQYLQIYAQPCQLTIVDYPYSLEPFTDYSCERRLIYSKTKDSLALTSKILGSWWCDSTINLIYGQQTDTLVFTKAILRTEENDCIYTFKRNYGHLYCKSKCTEITYCSPPETFRNLGYAPDSYYDYIYDPGNECAIDLENQQLVFTEGEVSYQIIELSETRMILIRTRQ